jgi:hypothetical protein
MNNILFKLLINNMLSQKGQQNRYEWFSINIKSLTGLILKHQS